uniref:thiol:disulfide interchange protein n=1 Tax=Crassiphycus crassissimus TaxID=2783451 RepID=UPI001D1169E5|nr:thiol:disulfide interchange protein [Crassiphycus crassissimus]UAD84891.1 thiol:disulfide interchange protein [Crassiphycus crassissimus]UAD85095.1 thiol:disulfide interchange protein [Crassiphycus crassissimus]
MLNLLNTINYQIEQKLLTVLTSQINHAYPIVFILLIFSGLLTSFNPCLLSIIPTSLSYIYGEKLTNKNKRIFILGILSSITFSVPIFQILHREYEYLFHIFPILSHIITIIISLNLLQIFEFNNNFNFINNSYQKLSFIPLLYNYMTGFIIGISSTSCTIPILLIIIFWISSCKSWFLGTIYTLTYLLSYTLPIYLIINNSIKFNQLNKWPPIWNNITLFSGCIMLGYSIFSLLNTVFI